MNIVEREITHIGAERPLRVVSVQLVSPFANGEMETHKYYNWISWTSSQAEDARRKKVETILETLRPRQYDVLVFPEYSVPESLHTGDLLQHYADSKNCIVIPGTFSPTVNSNFADYTRNNICRIFIPNQQPLLIAKKELHPDEEKFVASGAGVSNAARLIWKPPNRDQVSISVFICRDYLKPFRKTQDTQMISELDWTREGLNIVLMESKETGVFLGRAAIEIRRLRGPGKIVLLANSARNGGELATAIIGPSPDRKAEFGDVVESVPADSEGILSSDISLSKVEYRITRPDKTIISPIQNTRIDLLSTEINDTIQLNPLPKHGPRLRRGVWHPALLSVLERKVVISLFQTRRLRPIRETFKSHVSSVYAGIVRGFDDIMVRRYDRDEGPYLDYPFSVLNHEEQANLLGKLTDTISVQPNGILKYRGCKFDPAFWNRERAILGELLENERSRESLIETIAALAEDWDNPQISESIKEEVSVAFDGRVEATIPLDQDVSNGIREAYVLIGLSNQQDLALFRQKFLGRLLDDENVRELFYPIATGLPFQYMLKLKCTQSKADEIVLKLRDDAERSNLEIGTRTFEVMEYLQKESVIGLADANVTAEVKLFFSALQRVDSQASRNLNLKPKTQQFLQVASAYARQRTVAINIARELIEDLSTLYCNLYFGNFIQAAPDRQRRYLQNAHAGFSALFQFAERRAEEKMSALFNVRGRPEIFEEVKNRFPQVAESGGPADPLDLMLKLSKLFAGDDLENQFRKARSLRTLASDLRNLASHGSMRQYERLDISSDDWQTKLRGILASTSAVLDIIAIISSAEPSQGPK
jgi:predicted amidohydrolase